MIQEAQVNIAYKYFLNLDPEDPLMHPSSLTKFRKLRLNHEEILEEMKDDHMKNGQLKPGYNVKKLHNQIQSHRCGQPLHPEKVA